MIRRRAKACVSAGRVDLEFNDPILPVIAVRRPRNIPVVHAPIVFAHGRIAQPEGDRGSLALAGADDRMHAD